MSDNFYLVAGLGTTGHSIARYLKRRNCKFAMFDTRANPRDLDDFKLNFPDIEIYLEDIPYDLYPQLTEIIASPGVSLTHPVIHQARTLGISIVGDIECFAREVKAPVIAITGTNGKSTVTTLVYEMARAAGFLVALGGNIGVPVLDLLDDGNQYDMWVLELSSFQLDIVHTLRPLAATILNITEDHLDRHGSLQQYINAKQRIYSQAKNIIYNRDDLNTKPLHTCHDVSMSTFGLSHTSTEWGIMLEESKYYLCHGENKFLAVDQLPLKGRHNWINALAACALSVCAEIDFKSMVQVLKNFTGLSHRTQWVRTINGVEWINDSKGTNVGATMSAISGIGSSIAGKIVLIAGGQSKGACFKELRPLVEEYVSDIILLGIDAEIIAHDLTGCANIVRVDSLETAVRKAKQLAKNQDVVLLSPACASLDMFRDFNHRGEVFVAAVEKL